MFYTPKKNSTLKKTKKQKLKELYDLCFITSRRLGTSQRMELLNYVIQDLGMTPEEEIKDVDKLVDEIMMSYIRVEKVNINDF